MLKDALRRELMSRRMELSDEALSDKSIRIANRLLELPLWSYDYYHLFLPITAKKEVDTGHVLSILQGKDKNIVLPKMGPDQTLNHILLTDSTVIRPNKYGVPEPDDGLEVPAEKIDVVFLPLLAFDAKGNRVGYGKGFYDNFLKECRPELIKVGLSFFDPVGVISDVRADDVPLNFCVTPEKIYSFAGPSSSGL